MIKIKIINNFRENKEVINNSFSIFKYKYKTYESNLNREIKIIEIQKIINETLNSLEYKKINKRVLNDFYKMVMDMFITMSELHIIEKNINILLNNN